MPEPLVSIVTPTFNHELFIGECIQSVLAQTWENWEMIVVDDGSTDRTLEIASDYAAKDDRIHLFSQSNKGPGRLAETYNLALKNAQGEWIAILEGDDYWFPEKLQVQLATHSERTLISYGVYIDRVGDKLYEGRRPPFQGALPCRDFIVHLLMHKSFMIAVTTLVRANSLRAIGGFHQDGSPAAVDMATVIRLVQLPGEVFYLPQPLGVWRHHSAQSTNTRAIELAKFNTALVLDYYDGLALAEKQAMGVSRQDILRGRRAQIADAYFTVLRQALRWRRKRNTWPLISGLWCYGGIKRKAQAVYAIPAVLLGFDFEPILSWVERLSGKS
jgi:glycosyltransferase involved in cell wall biosynthesis